MWCKTVIYGYQFANTFITFDGLFSIEVIKKMVKQIVSYEDLKGSLGLDLLNLKNEDIRLMNLCCAVREGYIDMFDIFTKNALDAGYTNQELIDAVSSLIRDGPELNSIIHFLKVLRFEESNRKEHISVIDDYCRED